MADVQIGVSVSDMRISQQAVIKNVRFSEERKIHTTTTIIVREEETEDSIIDSPEEK